MRLSGRPGAGPGITGLPWFCAVTLAGAVSHQPLSARAFALSQPRSAKPG
jgi:hypothetical protein